MSRTDNILNYIKFLGTNYSLNLLDDYNKDISEDNEEDENNFTIPVNLVSETDMRKLFIENTKHMIRNTTEYKHWVKWYKLKYTPIICSVSDNTTTIELHHHPLTLEDYVNIALSFIYDNNLTYTSMLIGDIVMRWHYKDCIGACYMSKTYHKRFHDFHDKPIPEDRVEWNIDNFMNDYIIKNYINEYIIGKISTYMPNLITERSDLFKDYIEIINKKYKTFKEPE